jgi:hypothetical protein
VAAAATTKSLAGTRQASSPSSFSLANRAAAATGRHEKMAAPARALSPAHGSTGLWARRRRGAPRRCFATRRRRPAVVLSPWRARGSAGAFPRQQQPKVVAADKIQVGPVAPFAC